MARPMALADMQQMHCCLAYWLDEALRDEPAERVETVRSLCRALGLFEAAIEAAIGKRRAGGGQ